MKNKELYSLAKARIMPAEENKPQGGETEYAGLGTDDQMLLCSRRTGIVGSVGAGCLQRGTQRYLAFRAFDADGIDDWRDVVPWRDRIEAPGGRDACRGACLAICAD